MKPPATRTVAALYVAATFAIGAVAGGAVSYAYGRKQPPRRFDPEAMRQQQKERYAKELGLSPAQIEQLDLILRQGMDEFGACHREHMDRVHDLMKRGQERIAGILTPEQKVEFLEMEKKREEKFARDGRGDRRSPPPSRAHPRRPPSDRCRRPQTRARFGKQKLFTTYSAFP